MNWSYLFKHWFATLLIAPFICEFLTLLIGNTNRVVGLVEMYPLTLIFSVVFSTPTYIIYGFIYYLLAKKEVSVKNSKIILLIFTIICVLVTFHIVFNAREFIISFSYAISSLITGLFFKLKFRNQ